MEKSKTLLAPWQEGTIPLPVYTLSLLEGAKSHATIQTILDDPGVAYGVIRRGRHNRAAVYFLGLWNVDLFFEKGSKDYMQLKEMMAEGVFDRVYQKPFGVFNLSKIMGYPGVMNDHHRIKEIIKEHPAGIRALPTLGKNVSDYWVLDEKNGLYLRRTDSPNPRVPRNAHLMDQDARQFQESLIKEYKTWRSWKPTDSLWPSRISLKGIAQANQPEIMEYHGWRPQRAVRKPNAPRKRYYSPKKEEGTASKDVSVSQLSSLDELVILGQARFELANPRRASPEQMMQASIAHLQGDCRYMLPEGIAYAVRQAHDALQDRDGKRDAVRLLDDALHNRILALKQI